MNNLWFLDKITIHSNGNVVYYSVIQKASLLMYRKPLAGEEVLAPLWFDKIM